MNEVVAVIYKAVADGRYVGTCRDLQEVYSDEFVEADTFAFFRNLMALAILPLFAVAKATKQLEDPIGDLPAVNPQTVIQRRCESIMSDLLQKHDKELYRWLETKHQVPQVFLLRWIRLLFCREFSLEQSLEIWTAIFDDAFQHGIASLPLTDYFAIAMMQHIRDELLRADQSGCMKLLMHYPCQQNVAPLIVRANTLRTPTLRYLANSMVIRSHLIGFVSFY